ncbi:hypothetical protein [Paenibacillus sp. FSL L8-0463]
MKRFITWMNEDQEKKNPNLTAVMTLVMIVFSLVGATIFFGLVIHAVVTK